MTSDIALLPVRLLEERDLEPMARSLGLSRHHIEGRWRERLVGQGTTLVAELDGATAGSVSFEERGEFPRFLHLYALAVLERLWRRGIGRRLVTSVEEEARARGLEGVYLGVAIDNAGAQRLYEGLGYQRAGEPYTTRWTWYGPDGEEREVAERCYRMFKRLGPAWG